MSRPACTTPLALSALVLSLGMPSGPARAQQSLEVFLDAAERHEPNLRAAREDEGAARSRVDEARATLLPRLTASAGYTRNDSEVLVQRTGTDGSMQTATILAHDQLDASVLLDVPLLDVARWSSFGAAEIDADGAHAVTEAERVRVRVAVIEAWHRLVGARAVIDASEERLRVALEAQANVVQRRETGLAPELDVARAGVEVGLAREVIANAQLEERLATQALRVASGLAPDASRATIEASDEALSPLAGYLERVEEMPALQAARERTRSAQARREASWQELLPSLRGFARGRFTNAAGFQPESLWSAGVSLVWTIDLGGPAAISTRDHELAAAEARRDATRLAAESLLVEAWSRVDAGRARLTAAELALEASERAVSDAHLRYDAARATQLDVLVAERERFDARVSRALALTQLAGARATLAALLDARD